jgi:hypothetical protein
MLIYCTFSVDDEYLTIDIADVLTAGNTTADPSRLGHLLNQVIRILDVLGQEWDLGRVLLVEELLRYGAALLAQTHLLRVEQTTLHIRVTAAIAHEGDRVVGTGLWADIALMAVKYGLITESTVCIDKCVIVAVALTRVDVELGHRNGIDAGCLRHQVSGRSYRGRRSGRRTTPGRTCHHEGG